MKNLVTGGAGFIGSHLAERLVGKKQHVFVIDDLSTGKLGNLRGILSSPYLHLYKDSILNEDLIEKIIKDVDVVYHLAASVGVKLIMDNPIKSITNNIHGTEIILKYVSKYRKKVLISSTSEVYGKSTNNEFSENDDLILGPTTKLRWNYACSKIIDEFLGLSYSKMKRLPVVIARLFNTVGERQSGRYGMVIPRFIKQAINNDDVTIFGDGNQSRCFCYVGDVVWALTKLMENEQSYGEIFNIGNTESVTIKNLATLIISLTKSKSKKRYIPYEDVYGEAFEEPKYRMPNIEKIQNLIEFEPKHNLESIIMKVMKYFS